MKKYIIAWRAPYIPGRVANTVFGLVKYSTAEAAWAQVAVFKRYFQNQYYVFPV